MANVTVTTVKIPVTTYCEEKQYVLTLTESEAQTLRNIFGHISGSDNRDVNSIYTVLIKAGLNFKHSHALRGALSFAP